MSEEKPKAPAPEKRRWSMFPKNMSQCIEPLTRPVLKARGMANSKLITQWHSVVGEEMARRCLPEKLSFPQGKTTDGTLTIAVENGFATELQHLQPVIIERLSTYFGYRAVSRIVISHGFVRERASDLKPIKRSGNLPPEAVAMAAGIEDDEMRVALQAFARTLSKKREPV